MQLIAEPVQRARDRDDQDEPRTRKARAVAGQSPATQKAPHRERSHVEHFVPARDLGIGELRNWNRGQVEDESTVEEQW